jgi:phosphonate transport system substrate-binding protein
MIPTRRVLTTWHVVLPVFLACALAAGSARSADPYVFAVIPSAPPVATHTAWAPVVERLGRATGLDFRLKVYEKMSEFELDITRGGPDFLFSSPLQAVVAHLAQDYAPLVRGSRPVSAVIIVRTDSSIKTVDELAGKTIAFVGSKTL